MKRLMIVGGLVAVLASVAALQHSPPAQDYVMALKAATPVVALAPSVLSAPTQDLLLVKVVVGQHIVVPRASLRNLESVPRPTRRGRYTLTPNANTNNKTRYVANMRGWGFL